jgi:hypothetical protein
MRRIAAVAVTAGALMAGLGAVAAPANAAPGDLAIKFSGLPAGVTVSDVQVAATNWTAPNTWARVGAYGKYTRGPARFYGSGTIYDGGRDGYQACFRFRFTRPGQEAFARGCIVDSAGRVVDRSARVNFTFNYPRWAHVGVQEVRRRTSTGALQFGTLKRLF